MIKIVHRIKSNHRATLEKEDTQKILDKSVGVRNPQFNQGIWVETLGFSAFSTDIVTLRHSFPVRWP